MIRSLFFLFIGIFVSAQTTSFVMNGVVLNEENKPINTARIRKIEPTNILQKRMRMDNLLKKYMMQERVYQSLFRQWGIK